ncbi:S8 family peptidase [Pseudalkalibacillus sp. R45]|uniref:S8 family peptidase n=1 Tax=Pseudalkalibacillus sp. R45 TaxID=3457433 RepID=UPI003FCD46F4
MSNVHKKVLLFLLVFCLSLPLSAFAKNSGESNDKLDSFKLWEIKGKSKNIKTFNTEQTFDLNEVNERQIIVNLIDPTKEIQHPGLEDVPISNRLKNKGYRIFRVPATMDYKQTLKKLKSFKEVKFVEPDFLKELNYQPTDPYYDDQWYLEHINMPAAWDVTTGSEDIVVAVLDSGVNNNHPDLAGKVLPGYDFGTNDNNPSDNKGHGTAVAGVIAANSNSIGITGLAFNTKILPVKVSNEDGRITDSAVIEGIYYAIDQGADIINMSFGSELDSVPQKSALVEAYLNDITLVASAGNDGTYHLMYPASYPFVISVASTNDGDTSSSFSNFGDFIDLSAPGEGIITTNLTGTYSAADGTSFSAPIVSGIAALVKTKYPHWGPAEIEWALENGAQRWYEGVYWTPMYGYGRVDGYNSLINIPDLTKDVPNRSSEAISLNSGEAYTNRIDMPDDTDWYELNVTNRSEVTIDITNVPYDLDIEGIILTEQTYGYTEIKRINQASNGEDEHLVFNVEPGVYKIGLYDLYNHWATDEYIIKVKTVKIDTPVLTIPNVDLPSNHRHPVARLHIRRSGVNLMKKENDGSFTFYKELKRNEFYRTYGVEGNYYNVGGPYFVKHEAGKMAVYIGRANVEQDTPLYAPDGSFARTIRKGEAIRVYSYDNNRFNVGGGYYIKNNSRVFYTIGYVTLKQDNYIYNPNGQIYERLPAGNRYWVYGIEGKEINLGGGYYILDDRNKNSFMKN